MNQVEIQEQICMYEKIIQEMDKENSEESRSEYYLKIDLLKEKLKKKNG
jgi:hypothetical protein